MKPVMQASTGYNVGDCLRACVASLFEQDAGNVPNFVLYEDWWDMLIAYCKADGRFYPFSEATREDGWTLPHGAPERYAIALGKTALGSPHGVVTFSGQIIHDPHPDRPGLREIEGWIVFVPWIWKEA